MINIKIAITKQQHKTSWPIKQMVMQRYKIMEAKIRRFKIIC